jgi:hypothetical protein
MDAHGPWAPLSVAEMQAAMAGFAAPWWIAGGWAVDLALGRQTRVHGDTDIAVLRRDQPALFRHLCGWDVQIVADKTFTPWREGDWLEGGERFQFWVRREAGAPWAFEILLEETDGEDWLYRRDPRIRLPLARFGAWDADGAPHVCLPVALLYKSNRLTEARNAADFEVSLAALDADARLWLTRALQAIDPAHPWIARLAEDR